MLANIRSGSAGGLHFVLLAAWPPSLPEFAVPTRTVSFVRVGSAAAEVEVREGRLGVGTAEPGRGPR